MKNMKLKDYALAILMIALAIVAVMGWHWTDVAETKFWWTFWEIAAVASALLFIGIWVVLWNKKKKDDR